MSSTDSQVMIRVEGLTKLYGAHRAVDGVSFDVRRGEVVGFLGPNGAGKSTTMKMLTCFLAPSGGRAEVAGHDVFDEPLAVRRRIGYLPEDTPLYRDMTAYEYLEFVTRVRGVPAAARRDKIRSICELCGLSDVVGKLVGELSRGYRQRVGLAQAMVHDPDILILDEPTSGLDPNQIVEIRSLIKRLGEQKTVILSTHILPEVQATCGRVLIISDGKIVADGSPRDLTRGEGEAGRVDVEVVGPPEAVRELLERVEGVTRVTAATAAAGDGAFDGAAAGAVRLTLGTRPGVDVRADVFRAVAAAGFVLLEQRREAATLEEVFRRLTTHESAGAHDARAAA